MHIYHTTSDEFIGYVERRSQVISPPEPNVFSRVRGGEVTGLKTYRFDHKGSSVQHEYATRLKLWGMLINRTIEIFRALPESQI